MKTSNPALSEKMFSELGSASIPREEAMTIGGTVNKTLISLLILIGAAIYTWSLSSDWGAEGGISPYIMGGAIGGFVVALITIFKKEWSPVTVPIYAALEGLFLGAISAQYAQAFYPGIVFQAIGLTMGTFLVMLLLYRSNLVPVTQKLRMGIIAATGGIAILYLFTWIMGFFMEPGYIPMIHQSGYIGIGFSLLVVGVAAFNLLLDFDFIEKASIQRVPKYMEWFGAFGILVTLIWLYIEFLRLLSKLRD